MKYYLMGVFASAVMLYGMSLIFGGTGTTVLAEIGQQVNGSLRRRAHRGARHRVRADRLRLQGLGGAVPQLGAGHLRGCAHPGHRVPVGRLQDRRLRGDPVAAVRRLLRPGRHHPAAHVRPGHAHHDRRQRDRPAADQHRPPVRLLVGRPGRVHPGPARGLRAATAASRCSPTTSGCSPRSSPTC